MTDAGHESVGGIEMVVFDLGGVFVRICRSWQEGCAAAGLDVRPGSEAPALVERRRALSHDYQVGAIECGAFFRGVSETTGGAYTPDEIRAIHDAWMLGDYPGVEGVVGAVHGAGIATGVLSNTNHRHWEQLRAEYRSPWLVGHTHASHLLRLAKPDVAIYRAFECEVGVAPERILFFDDLPENVEAARAAGWRSERIDHAGDTAKQMLAHLAAHGVG